MKVRPLFLTIPLQPGEESLDYLSRLAARNGIPCAKHFCTDWELEHRRLVDGCAVETARLAYLALVPAANLLEARIVREGKAFHMRGERLVAASVRRNRFHVCPACLGVDIQDPELPPHVTARGRLAWHVAAVRTCAVHGLGLVDLGAGSGVEAHDFTAVVRPNLKRIDELVGSSVRRMASELERYIARRLDGEACDAPFLDALELHVAIRLCEVVGALAVHGRGVSLTRLGENGLQFAGGVGIVTASRGKPALLDFLANLRRSHPYGCRVKAGPRPPFAEFQSWLAGHSREDAYEPIRALVARHMNGPTPVDIPDRPGVFCGNGAAKDYAKIMGQRPWIIRDGLAESGSGIRLKLRSSSVSRSQPAVRGLDTWRAARYLGCDPAVFLGLVAHGFVAPMEGVSDSDWRYAFTKDDLDVLKAHILAGAEPVSEVTDGMVGLDEGATWMLCAPAEIMSLLFQERFAWVGQRTDAAGIGSLLFERDELRSLVFDHEIAGSTLEEAADLLSIGEDCVAALIGMGAMSKESGRYAHSGVPVDVIPETSIKAFRAANIDFRLLSRDMSLKTEEGLRSLSALNVDPSYAHVGLGFVYVRRDEDARVRNHFASRHPVAKARRSQKSQSYKRWPYAD